MKTFIEGVMGADRGLKCLGTSNRGRPPNV